MKQLPMTPELSAMIKAAVGEDVETDNLAVFEAIALNTRPLPGKRGTIFENAVVLPITLKEMVDSINSGNHLPLIADHELFGAPKGRFFHAGLDYDDGLTMRALFYLDATEEKLITKLNAGTLDEVSVSFLSRELNCSECGWNYFNPGASYENIRDRICANGHRIGENGVHAEMNGLNQFIELSLVARGAADKPKIVGKSQSKLAPEGLQLLAAKGFEMDDLIVQASLGVKDDTMDLSAALSQITQLSTDKGTLTANLAVVEKARDEATAEVTRLMGEVKTRDEQIVSLTAERDEALKRPDAAVASERDEAVAFLQEQVDHLLVASGKEKATDATRLKTVAELKAKISELTGNLTSILPVGGKAAPAGGAAEETAKFSFKASDAYGVRK